MEQRNFLTLLRKQWEKKKFLCVGLDSDCEKIPKCLHDDECELDEIITIFNVLIIEATAKYACAFKLNRAFYDSVVNGYGNIALSRTIKYIKDIYPHIPVILDQKRDDIDKTNKQYASEIISEFILPADAITVHPTFGKTALQPFLGLKDKGIIVLCKTSNQGSDEFQNLRVEVDDLNFEILIREIETKKELENFGWEFIGLDRILIPLYQYIAIRVAKIWNINQNCALVVGATYPQELKIVRQLVGNGFPLLIPGIGTQGGDLEAVVTAGKDQNNSGMMINASSSIIFASDKEDFAEAAGKEAKRLHSQIKNCLISNEVKK